MPPVSPQVLLDRQGIAQVLRRMVQAILAFTDDHSDLVLIGIQRRGVELAERIAREIEGQNDHPPLCGALDITLYRDDLQLVGPRPIIGETRIPANLEGRLVFIVDDVLFTGRTIRAALAELTDFGRPRRIGLAVLIDRGGRELPIQADVVGERITVEHGQRVDVLLAEVDGRDAVELVPGQREGSSS